MATPSGARGGPTALVVASARRQTVRLAAVMAAVNLLLPIGLWIWSELSDQPWWRMFRGESSAVAWFSSVQLLLVAAVAYANHVTARLAARAGRADLPERRWLWPVFAAGFVFLALDERFQIHEALRNQLFRPAGWFLDIPHLIPGDVGLYLFFGVGLVFSVFLLPELRRRPPALALFAAALALTLPVVVIDSLADGSLRSWPFWRFWDHPFEEVGELWAQLLFLSSFLVVLHGRLEGLTRSDAP